MEKLVWFLGSLLTLYLIFTGPVTPTLAWLALACIGIMVYVLLTVFLFRTKPARLEKRTILFHRKKPRVPGFGWLFGYREVTGSTQTRIDGDKDLIEELTGEMAEEYGWIPMGGPLGSFAPKKDVGPTWAAIIFGAIAILVGLIAIFVIIVVLASNL